MDEFKFGNLTLILGKKSKSKKKWGWVIAVPSIAWTGLISTVYIVNGANSEIIGEYILLSLPTAITSYIGIKMINDANNKIKKLEEERIKSYIGLMIQPDKKSFCITYSLHFY